MGQLRSLDFELKHRRLSRILQFSYKAEAFGINAAIATSLPIKYHISQAIRVRQGGVHENTIRKGTRSHN